MECIISDEKIKHGPFNGQSKCVNVKDLKKEVTVAKITVSERDLISSRIGKSLDNNSLICPNHRSKLGVHWKPSVTCCHPDNCLLKGSRAITSGQYDKIKRKFGKFSVPVGGLLCQNHRTGDLYKQINDPEKVESVKEAEKNLDTVRKIIGAENGHHVLKLKKVILKIHSFLSSSFLLNFFFRLWSQSIINFDSLVKANS